jgi:hypothetical protein
MSEQNKCNVCKRNLNGVCGYDNTVLKNPVYNCAAQELTEHGWKLARIDQKKRELEQAIENSKKPDF